MDVAFTSDNVPVLLHDTTINRTARTADGAAISTTIDISSITYAQALEYDFGIYKGSQYAGLKIPKLQDVLIYLRQKNCCAILDLLGHTYTQAQYTILHDLLVGTNMVAFSALNAYQEQLDVYAELYNDTPFNPTSTTNSFSITQSAFNKYKDKCPLIIVSGDESNASDTTFTYFAKANALGVVTLLGMMDTVESIQNLFNAGCRMVYSDTIRETQLD
jgi:glycerophosphoryl diester phosphodiesterase